MISRSAKFDHEMLENTKNIRSSSYYSLIMQVRYQVALSLLDSTIA